jgi:choline monooxygenase
VQAEDIKICESVQRGLESGAFEVGRYAPRVEHAMHAFHRQLALDLMQSRAEL